VRPFAALSHRCRVAFNTAASSVVNAAWKRICRLGLIGAGDRTGRRFGRFGTGSAICFPPLAISNERHVGIGAGTIVGPYASLTVFILPGQSLADPIVLRIGDRCVIGRGTTINAHVGIDIGDDVWTGPNVYITDHNHGYEDVTRPIGPQPIPPGRPVTIGAGSWLGYGAVVLPGARIGRHVVIGASAVVSGEIPDYSVVVGNPGRVVKRHVPGEGWVRCGKDGGAVVTPAPPRGTTAP
jgi:acetyltransferase-like isoleucine patch superfamily enzyme